MSKSFRLLIISIVSLSFFLNIYSEDYLIKTRNRVKGIKIENVIPEYKGKSKVLSGYEVLYDDSGRVILEKNYDENDILWEKSYIYENNKKNIIKFCKKLLKENSNDTILEICEDKKDNIVEIKFEKMKDGDILQTVFVIREKSKCENFFLNPSLEIEKKYVTVLDENGNVIEEMEIINDIPMEKIRYQKKDFNLYIKKYDKDDLLKEEYIKEFTIDNRLRKQIYKKYSFSQNVVEMKEIFYNNMCLKEEEKWYDSTGKIYRKYMFEYNFNDKGDWDLEYKYLIDNKNKKLESLVKREIKYK